MFQDTIRTDISSYYLECPHRPGMTGENQIIKFQENPFERSLSVSRKNGLVISIFSWNQYINFNYFLMQFCFCFFQISKNTIQDIDQRVRRISNIARKYYSKTELEPLDILETKTDDTIRMMMELRSSMNCERIHMWVLHIFFSYQTCLLFFVDVYFSTNPYRFFLGLTILPWYLYVTVAF